MQRARVDRKQAYHPLLWDDEVADLGGRFWRKDRISQSTFSVLSDELRGDLHRLKVQAVRREGQQERGVRSMAAETQLAPALRFFAGGSYPDVRSSRKVLSSSFSVTLHRVIKAIYKSSGLSGNLHSVDGRTELSNALQWLCRPTRWRPIRLGHWKGLPSASAGRLAPRHPSLPKVSVGKASPASTCRLYATGTVGLSSPTRRYLSKCATVPPVASHRRQSSLSPVL